MSLWHWKKFSLYVAQHLRSKEGGVERLHTVSQADVWNYRALHLFQRARSSLPPCNSCTAPQKRSKRVIFTQSSKAKNTAWSVIFKL